MIRNEAYKMCNLYANTTNVEAMRRLFDIRPGLDRLGNAPPREAIRPNYLGATVKLTETGDRELIEMNWGFLTKQYSKRDGSPIKPKPWNNARDDSIFGKASGLWKDSFLHRRCLIPASSFSETKGRNPAEYYWFGLKAEDQSERPPFAIAGLWREEHEDLRGSRETAFSYTMITTEANQLVSPIHAAGRMPAILEPRSWNTWLRGSASEAFGLLRPLAASKMRIIKHGMDDKADLLPQS